jgi:ABC-2 type transport system ATP-binding protein
MIQVREVTKRYGARTVVDRLSFTAAPGQVTGFLGPNGAGKSTTMRMIVGLDAPTSGDVLVNGKPYASAKAPLRELGVLLEAKAGHPGRTAVSHLLALARAPGSTRCSTWPDFPPSRTSGSAPSRSAWASGSASPPRCSATRPW